MTGARTRAWWWSRIELLIALAVIAIDVSSIGPLLEPKSGNPGAMPVVPYPLVVLALTFTLAIVGLVWMVRILRGPKDASPTWRYRDP